MLPYDAQIKQLEQNIGVITETLHAEILTKVTNLLTDNIEAVVPELPRMKQRIDDFIEDAERQASGGSKTFNIASQCREEIIELKGEFERICQTNKQKWEKEADDLSDKYQNLKKRASKGEKRREQILNLAKKQKNQYQKEISALKDSIICSQAKEKQYEMEKDCLRKTHDLEVTKLQRQIDSFRLKASEFEGLLYGPGSVDTSRAAVPMPDMFASISAGVLQQNHEIAEISRNLDDFQEKQADLEKVV